MNRNRNRAALVAGVALLLFAGSCNDINRQEAPVDLVVTNTQILHQLDLAGDAPGSTKCQQNIANVHMLAIRLQPSSTNPNVTPADLDQIRIDPETHKPFVSMDVILEVFGSTLAGERVSGSTRMSLDFCFSCGGCA